LPASVSVMHDPKLRSEFETYCQTPQFPALDRMKLMKVAWDMVGSEFAGRQQHYEKFYAGPSFLVRSHSFREANWKFFDGIVEKLMAGYDVPEAAPKMNTAE
jgi:4-hydroxyphenylacetate 3-monooxygenase